MLAAPEQQGVRGDWECGSLEWLVTSGDPWILALERNTSEGRSSKATGWPSASFFNARVIPKELLKMKASPHMMELSRVLRLDVGPAWMSSNICSDRSSQNRSEPELGCTQLGKTWLRHVASTITELCPPPTTPVESFPMVGQGTEPKVLKLLMKQRDKEEHSGAQTPFSTSFHGELRDSNPSLKSSVSSAPGL